MALPVGLSLAVAVGLAAALVMAWRWPRVESDLALARASLAAHKAAEAERALRAATSRRPADPAAWRLLLELLRLEDRRAEADTVGRAAREAIGASAPPAVRDAVLKGWTLAMLADVPDDVARSALWAFVEAEPADVEARLALLRRVAADPRPGDPPLAERIATLAAIVAEHPGHAGSREALAEAWLDAGQPGRARAALDGWPAATRDDPRYLRLDGRLALEHERDAPRAAEVLSRAAASWPHDGRARYLLARALHATGRADEARREAEAVARLRETTEPRSLGKRLDAAFARLEDPESRRDLASLCDRAGLPALAAAWRDGR